MNISPHNAATLMLEPLNGISYDHAHKTIFSHAKGQIGCLRGPSGCGETIALRSIAGFESVGSVIATDRKSD